LTRSALDRLADIDDTEPDDLDATEPGETIVSLAQQRRGAVLAALHASGARRVGDLGCGEGALVGELLADQQFTHVVAADVSSRALEFAERKLRLDRMPPTRRERLILMQSSLTYRDSRLIGLDAVVLMEVIEHVDPPRLPALARNVFGSIAPETVVVTTPNVEYNVRYPTLLPGRRRHRDHRFEWTRAEFADWAGTVADDWSYQVRHLPVGDEDPELGAPTQMAVFTRNEATA
jgi:3' terminal RNA ribose 2'-O-methyltransferase Hen1